MLDPNVMQSHMLNWHFPKLAIALVAAAVLPPATLKPLPARTQDLNDIALPIETKSKVEMAEPNRPIDLVLKLEPN
jgi:hypothetical protein